jgi:tetratricopeptide (TPR) repeat protein
MLISLATERVIPGATVISGGGTTVDWILSLHSRPRRAQILDERIRRARELLATDAVAAEAKMRRIIELCRLHLGDRDLNTLDAEFTLGCTQVQIGRYDDALATLSDSIARYDVSLKVHRNEQRFARAWLWSARAELGERERAVKELRAVVDEARAESGDDADCTLHCQRQLASVLNDTGEFAEAVAIMTDVVAGRTRRNGADHRFTLCSRHDLGLYLVDVGELDRAEGELAAAVAPSDTDVSCTIVCAYGAGRIAAGRGHRADAERLYRSAIQGWTDLFGPDHPSAQMARDRLAELGA